MNNIKDISIIGLGKLGACLAATLASKGFQVIGFDTNKKVVDLINLGKAPVIEPDLAKLINKSKKNLRATIDPEEIIKNTDITFIIVPTPSKKDGCFSNEFLKNVFITMAPYLKNKKTHHMFVVDSTVMPTTIDKVLIPLIEKSSGKKLNVNFSVCYNPEFIALGDVINGILNPDVVLIGESNKSAGDKLSAIYEKLCNNKPYISRMSLVSAEIMKIALNSFVTMKISFANTLGNICERIPGADVDAITKALGADKRISPYYIKAGLPFGGPCFPRDNRAFQAFAGSVGIDAKLAEATDQIHDFQIDNFINKIKNLLKKDGTNSVSILGLSYKPKTGVIEESPAIKIIEQLLLLKKGIKINVFDILAIDNTKDKFKDKINYADSVQDCLRQSNFWIIASPEKDLIGELYRLKTEGVTIVDCWRAVDFKKIGRKTRYLSLGGNFYE